MLGENSEYIELKHFIKICKDYGLVQLVPYCYVIYV